jgi:hypothetical protein
MLARWVETENFKKSWLQNHRDNVQRRAGRRPMNGMTINPPIKTVSPQHLGLFYLPPLFLSPFSFASIRVIRGHIFFRISFASIREITERH